MVNINKLKGKLVEKGYTVQKLAEAMKINPSTLYRKINDGGMTFTVKEIMDIADILHLTTIEINEIFFAQEVA